MMDTRDDIKKLIGEYRVAHPVFGTDGWAYPMLPLSLKYGFLNRINALNEDVLTDFAARELLRLNQIVDAIRESDDYQLNLDILYCLKELLKEDIENNTNELFCAYDYKVTSLIDHNKRNLRRF